jgi:hypothetical protein
MTHYVTAAPVEDLSSDYFATGKVREEGLFARKAEIAENRI